MIRKFLKGYLHLLWKSPTSRRRYLIGELSKNGNFQFKYLPDVSLAIEYGFVPIIAFLNIKKIYNNDVMFPVFSTRLPDKKRVDIENILSRYGMKDYDEFELLKRSGSKSPTDHLEFIDPIFYEDLEFYKGSSISRVFSVAGSRYYIGCSNGETCSKSIIIKEQDIIDLVPEPENIFDIKAIKVLCKGHHIGYVPRCYSEALTEIIAKKIDYNCFVKESNKNSVTNV